MTGVIDTLSAGFAIVNRHPWIVLIPVLLDLFLWFGPQLSAAQLVSRTLSQVMPLGAGRRSDLVLNQAQQQELVQFAEGTNLLAGLAHSMISVVGVPSLLAVLGIRDPLRSIPVESWGVALAIAGGSVLGGLLLGSVYYAILAQEVRDGAVSLARLVRQAIGSWLRVLQYLVLMFGLGMLFGVPIGFVALGATALSPTLGGLVSSTALMGAVWVGIYLFFVPEAIVVSQVGPLQAVKNSVAVVRLGFWSALAIMLLITVVLLGMGRIWELASERIAEPWGVGLGILGNAYIASGLVAASMRFYRERIEVLRASRQ